MANPLHATLLASVIWSDNFFGLDPDKRFVVIIVGLGCLTAIIISLAGIISSWANSMHRRRMEIELKRDMLDRGMSPDEITKVIEAALPLEDATSRWIASWCNKKK